MKFSKSVTDRLVFSDVDYLGKAVDYKSAEKEVGGKNVQQISTKKPYDKLTEGQKNGSPPVKQQSIVSGGKNEPDKYYKYHPKTQEMKTEVKEAGPKKTIPANAAHEKELKNASMLSVFDAILEKGRKRESERQGPKRVQESEGEGVELPGGSMATMGNPGGSKEKASFERAEPGALRNLKRLAESKDPSDQKASEAGLKRH